MSDLHHSCDPIAQLHQQKESDMFWTDQVPEELQGIQTAHEDITDAVAKLRRVRDLFTKTVEAAGWRGEVQTVRDGLALVESMTMAIRVLEKVL